MKKIILCISLLFLAMACDQGYQIQLDTVVVGVGSNVTGDNTANLNSNNTNLPGNSTDYQYKWKFEVPGVTDCDDLGFLPEGTIAGAPVTMACDDGIHSIDVSGDMQNPSITINGLAAGSSADVDACLCIEDIDGNVFDNSTDGCSTFTASAPAVVPADCPLCEYMVTGTVTVDTFYEEVILPDDDLTITLNGTDSIVFERVYGGEAMFFFTTQIPCGDPYDVTFTFTDVDNNADCTVVNGSGTSSSNITNVEINCARS